MKVLFHVRASPSHGFGHLIRAQRLARSWASDLACGFFLEAPPSSLDLVEAHASWIDRVDPTGPVPIEHRLDRIRDFDPDLVVIDMLEPEPELIRGYRDRGIRVLWLSDEGRPQPDADRIVCPNPRELWAASPAPNMVGGIEYVVIPPELLPHRGRALPSDEIFVNTGGATTQTTYDRVCDVLHEIDGSGGRGRYVLGFAADFDLGQVRPPPTGFEIVEGSSDLMTGLGGCGVALVTAGYIRYELAYLGIPMVLTSIADHQSTFGAHLQEVGVARYGGTLTDADPGDLARLVVESMVDSPERRRQIERGLDLVDGRGADRIRETLRELMDLPCAG